MKQRLLIADRDAELCEVFRGSSPSGATKWRPPRMAWTAWRNCVRRRLPCSCWIWSFSGEEVTACLPGCGRRVRRPGFRCCSRPPLPRRGNGRIQRAARRGLPSQALSADCSAGERPLCRRKEGTAGWVTADADLNRRCRRTNQTAFAVVTLVGAFVSTLTLHRPNRRPIKLRPQEACDMRKPPSKLGDPTEEKSPAVAAEPTGRQPSEKPGVLVVDEDHLVRIMVQLGLERNGFDVWLARSGQEAIDLYRRHLKEIKVVLLDVRTSGLGGLQTLEVLQNLIPKSRPV